MNMTMVRRLAAAFFLWCCAGPAMAAGADAPLPTPSAGQVRELQEKMAGDAAIMALITSLGSDPDVQALLTDPKVIDAVRKGDLTALLNDPRILKLMNGPQVKEIERRLQTPGSGGGK